MVERRVCTECQDILAELEAALAEIRVSPKSSEQLSEHAGFLLRLGTAQGADEAIEQFPFDRSQRPPQYPKIAHAFQRRSQHMAQTGHKPFNG